MAAARVSSVLSALAKRNNSFVCNWTGFLQMRCLSSEAQCTPGQWQLVSAVCLQRPPVITAEKMPMEERFEKLMKQLELESSLLSDHELHAKEDKTVAEKRKSENIEQGEEVEGTRQTALDLEDAWEAEAQQFTPASRVTEADTKNDQRSVERQLDQPLVLLVKQTLGDKSHWVFPQGPRLEGESVRQAAERVLQKHCGEAVGAHFLGNAPCGFYQYRFPPAASLGTGAKVFFYKAWYKDGDITLANKDVTDYMWVTIDELPNFCAWSYLNSIKNFLVGW